MRIVFDHVFPRYILTMVLFLTLSPTSGFPQEWTSRKVVGPFVCWGTFDLRVVETDIQSLGTISQELSTRLRVPPPQEWVEVYIFRDENEWHAFLRREYPELPYRRALFLKKPAHRGQLFLYLSPDFAVDIRHEGTHALLHAVLPDVPIWLDEGLAEYYEVAHNRAYDSIWLREILLKAKEKRIQKLKTLEKKSGMASMTDDDYADAWAWVNYLLNGPEEVRTVLPEYLAALATEKKPAPISKRLAKILRNPDEQLRLYFLDNMEKP
ncbi:MAG: hypothetical protein Q4D98_13740 [Planctomycetia bacterium]|nr:hypothetical protein [Planctomycetia bacterium]